MQGNLRIVIEIPAVKLGRVMTPAAGSPQSMVTVRARRGLAGF